MADYALVGFNYISECIEIYRLGEQEKYHLELNDMEVVTNLIKLILSESEGGKGSFYIAQVFESLS